MSDRSRPTVLRRAVTLGLLGVVAGACGNLTAGGFGNARVVVSGDAADPALGLSPAAPAPARSSHGEEPEGQIEVEFVLNLVSVTGGFTSQLGDDDLEVSVDLRGEAEADVVDEPVAAERYSALQIVFTRIEVQVDRGLLIDGVEVTGPIDVDFDDTTLLVQKAIDLDVTPGASVELLIDLNAGAWLQAVDPVTQSVDAAVFADRITVGTR